MVWNLEWEWFKSSTSTTKETDKILVQCIRIEVNKISTYALYTVQKN